MANPEHVRIVKAGADAIAEWRKSHPDERLELEGADLRHANLIGANLSGSNLAGADLRRAELYEVDLRGADLEKANLRSIETYDTDFRDANLRDANLTTASLYESNLDSADLREADFSFAQLFNVGVANANFEKALFLETTLADTDFSRARGLTVLRHDGPGVIDERTLRKSWPLPEVFLRGIGLSNQYIEYLPSLMGQAIEFYSCFISYSSRDGEFASRLHNDLQAEGVRCWFAPEDLRIGDKFRTRIDEAIRLHDKLLLILSEESVQSTWVENEVESAFEKEDNAKKRGEDRTVLFPIRLDSAVMETDAAWAANIRRTRHIGDFSAWKDHDAYKAAFERLLRDLKSE